MSRPFLFACRADPKAEFVLLVSARIKSLAESPDVLNRWAVPPCYRTGTTAAERRVAASLQTLTSKPASLETMRFVDYMRRNSPADAGIYDLNRYKKVADLIADEK